MHVLLMVNSSAGRGRAERNAEQAQEVLTAEGLDVVRLPADRAAQPAAVLRGIDEGASALVVCGGDGTVHTAVQALAGGDCPLGVIPSGTGDDNARSLGIPPGDAAGAAIRIAHDVLGGHHSRLDVARVVAADGRSALVLGVVSTGFDSTVNAWANDRSWPSGTAKYVLGMIRLLPAFRPIDYVVDVDGMRREGLGMLVCIGNGPSYGGGMLVCPQARRDDGSLDVMWLADVPTPRFLAIFPRVYAGTHVGHDRVTMLRGASVRVEARGQLAFGDGELIGPLPVTINCWPAALRVVGGGEELDT